MQLEMSNALASAHANWHMAPRVALQVSIQTKMRRHAAARSLLLVHFQDFLVPGAVWVKGSRCLVNRKVLLRGSQHAEVRLLDTH